MNTFGMRAIVFLMTLGLMIESSGFARQQPADAQLLFQAAMHAEVVEGNLERAIGLYQQTIDKAGANRALAAKALVRLGDCYQKLKRQEAQTAYQRVIREYADQSDAVQMARARLRELDGRGSASEPATGPGPTYRLVLDRLTGINKEPANAQPQFDFAPDGNRFVFRKPVPAAAGALLHLADPTGTLVRPLLKDSGSWWGFHYPRFAPNGRRIAYRVHKARYDAPGPWAIYVADPDTGAALQVGPEFPDDAPPSDLCWKPDGREITYLIPDGIYTMNADRGEPRLIQAMKVHYTMRLGGYSPDGRWLVFHRMRENSEDNKDLDLWMLPATGGRALQLTRWPGRDAQAVWAADGQAVYFVSDRSGDLNVWKLRVNLATGAPIGDAQQVTFFTDAVVMYPNVFANGRRMAFALSRPHATIKVADMARPNDARIVARGTSPQFSPDGRTMFYIGQGPDQQGLLAMPSGGGTPVQLVQSPPASGYDLSPDGLTLVYFARNAQTIDIYTVAARGGAPRLLVRSVTAPRVTVPISPPRWSPDGREIAYAQDNTLFVVAAAGGAPRKVAQLYQWQEWLWSPDGKHIGALAYAGPDDLAVFVVPAAGGEPRRLTPPEEVGYREGLAWHPDSQRLAYMIYVGPSERRSEVRQAYVDGRPTTLLVRRDAEWVYVGRWTPDGQRFLFLSNPDEKTGFDLFLHDPQTGAVTRFAEQVGSGTSGFAHGLATWSADGKTVAWVSQNPTTQLWLAENFR